MSADLLDRPLIIGARGQLGTDLTAVLADRAPVTPSRAQADLERPASLAETLERERPSIVISTAAYHNVDQCELHPDRAFAVNAIGVDALARACAERGIAFATVSTDYVFSGDAREPYDERDEPRPVNAYGVSKYAGELLARRHGSRWFIFRTAGLYGLAGSADKGYTFVERVLTQAARGEAVRVVDDQTCSPSYTLHVARAMRAVIESCRFGLYHLTNAGACTWFDFAREAFAQAHIPADLQPIKLADFKSNVRRPVYSALAHGELSRAGLPDLPDWRAGLHEYLVARG
jgi:dTDP-4-dehydrorhamnose reductase